MIYISQDGAIVPCGNCGSLVDCEPRNLGICPDCNEPLGADEHKSRRIRNTSSSDMHRDLGVVSDEKAFEEATEPEPEFYDYAGYNCLLALAGERLLS